MRTVADMLCQSNDLSCFYQTKSNTFLPVVVLVAARSEEIMMVTMKIQKLGTVEGH